MSPPSYRERQTDQNEIALLFNIHILFCIKVFVLINTSFVKNITFHITKLSTYLSVYASMLNAQNLSVGEMVVNRVCLDSARLVVAGHLVILQVEAAVHVVDAVRDLVLVRHHAQVEWLRSTRTHFASTSTSCI